MPYNSFTLSQLKESFGIEETTFSFVPANIPAVEISQHLLDDLAQVVGLALASEKAKSEHIVAPVLKEFRTKNRELISYFSGYQFEVDVERKLNGYCDFIFSLAPYKQSISAPVFFVVEAKKWEIGL